MVINGSLGITVRVCEISFQMHPYTATSLYFTHTSSFLWIIYSVKTEKKRILLIVLYQLSYLLLMSQTHILATLNFILNELLKMPINSPSVNIMMFCHIMNVIV